MKHSFKRGLAGLCAALVTLGVSTAHSAAPVSADILVVVDESGSMSGEQAWIREMIPLLEENLKLYGIGSEGQANEYGLVGYGNYSVAPRSFDIDGDLLGSDEDFVQAAQSLVTSGGTEDGWRAIDYALNEYPRRGGAVVNVILATDEDRDNTDNSITYQTVLDNLNTNRALLNAVINARFYCEDGRQALGIDAKGNGYVIDGSGGFSICSNPHAGADAGNTRQHYVDMALENGGAAWDLSFLRRGGHYGQSFTRAILAIKVDEILSQRPIGDLVAVAQITPNPAVAGQSITLDGSNSYHLLPEHNIVSWEWDLDNDGTFDASGPIISTSYASIGEYPVTLRIIDNSNPQLFAQTTVVVNVNTPPLKPTAHAGGPYQLCPQNTPWRLDGRGSINPDDGISEIGQPIDGLISYEWDLNNDIVFDDAFGSFVDATSQLTGLGIGDHLVRLRVTDNTANAFPSSGLSNLSDIAVTQVSIRDQSDLQCNCLLDLSARPKMTKVQLTWSDSGSYQYAIYRSTTQGGPYEYIATTDSRYSTYLDLGLELDTTYYYTVAEISNNGRETCRSREISTTPTARRFNAANRSPNITSVPVIVATEGQLYSYDVDATELDRRDAVTYSLQIAPNGMSIDSTTGLIQWLPINAQVGEQAVVVRASDNQGAFDEQIIVIQVGNVNQAPVISSIAEITATELQLYNYQIVAIDPDIGDVLSYRLDNAPIGMAIDTASGLISWTPSIGQAGSHSVIAIVRDSTGVEDTQPYVITVEERNLPPTITTSPATEVEANHLYSYQVNATDTNAGDTLTYSLGVFPTTMVIDPLTGIINWNPLNDDVGNHDITIVVSDTRMGSATQTFTLTVLEESLAPTITTIVLPNANEDVAYRFTIDAVDPNAGDSLNYSLITSPPALSIDSATGELQWLPVNNDVGDNIVTVSVTDTAGLVAERSYTLVVENSNDSPEITSAPILLATQGNLYSYQVTANDIDVGDMFFHSLVRAPSGMGIELVSGLIQWTPISEQIGSQLVTVRVTDLGGFYDEQSYYIDVSQLQVAPQITSTPDVSAEVGVGYQYQVVASDDNGDILTYSLATAPSGMTINGATGFVSWIPIETQVGSHPVVVAVSDQLSGVVSQSFGINVVNTRQNSEPSITSTPSFLATVDLPYSYNVNAVDTDGDMLVYQLTSSPVGMQIDETTGEILWVPVSAQAGENAVAITVDDGLGGIVGQSFTVTVIVPGNNTAPSITTIPSASAIVEQSYIYDVDAIDADGDQLEYQLADGPSGMSIDAVTGELSWIPAVNQTGEHAVAVRASDGQVYTQQSYTLLVRILNDNPTITSSPTSTAIAGLEYQYVVTATDPNNDILTYSLESAPVGMSMSGNGIVNWSPNNGDVGDHSITVSVDDGLGGVFYQMFTIQVIEGGSAQPYLTNKPKDEATVGELYRYRISATDQDGYAVTINLLSGPTGMSLDVVNGIPTLTWTPTEGDCTKEVTLRLTDFRGQVADVSFTIKVLQAPKRLNRIQCDKQRELCGQI